MFSNGVPQSEWEKMKQKQLEKIQRENGAIPILGGAVQERRYKQPDGPVVADLGDPPDGCEWPTHVRIGGELFMLVPPAGFEETVNMAFNRGYRMAVDNYQDQISKPVITEQIDYVGMVRRGDFDASGD